MKKFSKMLALGMAMSLVFGMTVCADPSVTVDTAGLEAEAATAVTAPVVEGDGVEAGTVIVPEAITDTTEMVAELRKKATQDLIVAAAGMDSSAKVELKIVKAFDAVAKKDGTEVAIPDDKQITVAFTWVGITDGAYYAVLHVKGNGEIETKVARAAGGQIEVTLTGLSPIFIVEVGETVPGDDNPTPPSTTPSGGNTNTDSNSGSQSAPQDQAPKSPQTGEVLPMAGIMALICLAGAGICAGKVRCNKQ